MKIRHTFALAALSLTTALAPVMAEARDHDWDDHGPHGRHGHWDDRGHHGRHDHWDNGRHRGHYKDRTRVVVTTAPIVRERVIVQNNYTSYAAPVYRTRGTTLRCTDQVNYAPALIGGIGGGLVGTQIGKGHGRDAAIIAGTLIGGALGHSYTYADRVCTREVFDDTPVGRTVYWQNPDTDYRYEVTPVREIKTAGRYCREYQARATVGNRQQETYGTACMQPDGSWEIVN